MFLKIFLILIILFILILLLKIRIIFRCQEKNITVAIKVLFFKITLYPIKEKNKEKKKEEKKEKKRTEEKDETQKKLQNLLKIMKEFLDPIKQAFAVFKKRCVLENLRFELSYSTGDAAQTAILYGVISAAIYNFILYLDMYFNIKNKDIHITPNYTDSFFDAEVAIDLYIRVFFILVISFKLLKLLKIFKYLKAV